MFVPAQNGLKSEGQRDRPLDLVSIVISSVHSSDFLHEAIESVLAQTYSMFEIIVVGERPSGQTEEAAARYSAVRYIRQKYRERSLVRNQGLKMCSGKFVVFLDADDRLCSNHLQTCLDAFSLRQDAGFVCGDYRWMDGESFQHIHDCRPSHHHYATLLRTNFIGPLHAVMFRREIMSAAGGFAGDFQQCEDQELYLRLAASHPIACHHVVIAECRQNEERQSPPWDRMLFHAMRMLHLHIDAAAGHASFQRAWRQGLTHRQHLYGEPLLRAMADAARSSHWARAMTFFLVIIRWYPQGLFGLLRQKVQRV